VTMTMIVHKPRAPPKTQDFIDDTATLPMPFNGTVIKPNVLGSLSFPVVVHGRFSYEYYVLSYNTP
jgi:hypothetical protein